MTAVHDGTTPAAPLTTVFTRPGYCGSTDFASSTCMPPGWDDYWRGDVGYYSPGICPEGYYAACDRPTTGSFVPYGPELEPSETATICCPDSYFCATTYQSYCTSYSSGTTSSAYAIQVRWAQTDLINLETNPTAPGVTPTSSETGTTIPFISSRTGSSSTFTTTTSSSITPGPTPSGSSGLSTGAKIGIGVAVPLVVVALVAGMLIFFYVRHQKKKSQQHPNQAMAPVTYQQQPSGQYANPMPMQGQWGGYQPVPPTEKGGVAVHDTSIPMHQMSQQTSPNPSAMASPNPASELSSTSPVYIPPQHHQGFAPPAEAPGNNTYIPGFVAPPPPSSGPIPIPPPQQSPEDEELQRLKIEQQRLTERRARLAEMEQLDEQERRLQQQVDSRMSVLRGTSSGPASQSGPSNT
ncbi:hypothetical protein K402DRAFT_406153 [Aulographum hederae CBS 113979]|uniref:Uncharacterized protein n=1 Tax=Aulographum hederae CBS 113979 TaxID=1176131 RepID=A0A6G1GT99_9PEZI|nr:hypothetical protein K402DRAFT_406153 [Aulographum hederae CBS 113979]